MTLTPPKPLKSYSFLKKYSVCRKSLNHSHHPNQAAGSKRRPRKFPATPRSKIIFFWKISKIQFSGNFKIFVDFLMTARPDSNAMWPDKPTENLQHCKCCKNVGSKFVSKCLQIYPSTRPAQAPISKEQSETLMTPQSVHSLNPEHEEETNSNIEEFCQEVFTVESYLLMRSYRAVSLILSVGDLSDHN